MIVLGFAVTNTHDPAAALLVNGEVAAAIEQERLSRRKHARGDSPLPAAAMCLELAGLSIQDVDAIALPHDFRNVRRQRWAAFRRGLGRRGRKAWRVLVKRDKVGPQAVVATRDAVARLGGDPNRIPIRCVEHHVAHAASAFFFSGMESAAVLTVDGEGEMTTTLFGEADRLRGVRVLHEIPRPDSLGLFYGSMTEYLGFERLDGEYKVMGMAPYGDAGRIDWSDIVSHHGGDFRINLQYVHPARELRYNGKDFSRLLVERFGPPREGDGLAAPYIHIAAATQQALEEVTLHLVEHHLSSALERARGRLCFAGGCALNVRLNQRLIRHPLVTELFVQPAAGDSGLALGAAAHVAHEGGDVIAPMTHSYHGPAYGQEEIDRVLAAAGLPWTPLPNPAAVGAGLLQAGHVLGWVQGRMEWGPRALGNRSIIGNPTIAGTADRINDQIKFRERWRPFCPSILEECAEDIVDAGHPSPFMTYSFQVRPAWRARVPEIVHVDGSARPQFVSKQTNPAFHSLIRHFYELSGCPVVINTSLNRRGEPLACSPEDALRVFQGSGLTHLMIGNALVVKPGHERDLSRAKSDG